MKFDQNRLTRIDQFINDHITQNHIAGANVLVMRNGEVAYNKSFGYADLPTKRLTKSDDIFRIASFTKAVTSLAAMMLWEEGKFLLDEPVSKYLPAFKDMAVVDTFNPEDSSYTTKPANREITIRDLFRHTSGLAYPIPYLSEDKMVAIYSKAGIRLGMGTTEITNLQHMEMLAKVPLLHQPGEHFTYGLSTDLLGYLVETWSGQSLPDLYQQRIFQPLEMNDTYFTIPAGKHHRLVSIHQPMEDGGIAKVEYPIFDGADPSYPNQPSTFFSGGAGLSGTIEDYAKFLTLFLNKGIYKDKRLLSPKTVALMLSNQLPEGVTASPVPQMTADFAFGLGFALETDKNDYVLPLSSGSFSWDGAFHTHYFADPKEQMIGIMLTQQYFSPYWSLRETFQNVVYQALVD
ncbi:serine hydrolase [Chitinophaga sp. SYP-B3965]|uniref:serine hydrolase domain-containing protein n=1 Tax=Chitinophaga sp. SYP-B3965 TaxID=2663120 RepID=UPI001299FF4F|nr:serine hydrolase domain-containing protein [Chitinophaga sp. SYP-B3965]MRG44676.1 serine hydrolase [Chitinophaga sp. SYP-B3965]